MCNTNQRQPSRRKAEVRAWLQKVSACEDLGTSAVNETPVGLEGDVGWIDEGLHLLGRLGAKYKGDQRVRVPVALQDMHVLVSAVSRGLRIEDTAVSLTV